MQFRTQIPIPLSNFPIDYNSGVVSLGSCFAENIGAKFDYYKFRCTTNPFGVIFNIVSIARILERAVQSEYFTDADVFFFNERWNCYEVHSGLSHSDKVQFLQNLNALLDRTRTDLLQATHVIFTLGTSWAYQHITSGKIVANCHKVPQQQFRKILLSSEENTLNLQQCFHLITSVNPDVRFLVTVSPVRHSKDGFVENQLSKAHLISAVHKISDLEYFPSYEIMMDELRDYRFYSEDMLHPNQIAIDYIWERFTQTFISPKASEVLHEIDSIQKALSHRPFNPDSASHRKFLEKLSGKIALLQQKYPHITF